MMTQTPDTKWIFPLEKNDNDTSSGIVFEPDEVTVLNSVITEYVAGLIISKVRESYTSEVVARRFAMDNAGKNASSWSIGDLSEWDVSNVTSMSGMFSSAGYTSSVWSIGDLSRWDVSSVTSMNNMFDRAGSSAKGFILNLSIKFIPTLFLNCFG